MSFTGGITWTLGTLSLSLLLHGETGKNRGIKAGESILEN